MESILKKYAEEMYSKNINELSNEQVYVLLLNLVKDELKDKKEIEGSKKLYYISSEFLIGKLLSNNLINLGLFHEVKDVLKENGKDLSEVEEVELEPSLGNGGLGRLAACFLDSIATLDLPCDGVGLNYHLGLFKQVFTDKLLQKETPNPWITLDGWLEDTGISYQVDYGNGVILTSNLKQIEVIGYNGGVNKLKLFDLQSIDESIVKEGIDFDKELVKKNLTLFLYPDDSDEAGELLRIYQQYFMVSNAAQMIFAEMKEKGYDLAKLNEHAVIQINDTHPTMVILEVIRILMEEGFSFDKAVDITSKTCAYTNHTILAEALEKWPLKYLEKVVPVLVPIIKRLDKLIASKYKDPKVQIIDKDKRVHMAHICIHFSYAVNGVAALHTQILKESELKAFDVIYPNKFNNKTNGITFRRWLMHANPELDQYLVSLIGDGFHTDANKLEDLLKYQDDVDVLNKLAEIKTIKKAQLNEHLKRTKNQSIIENSIVDIQVKRLHEYKRQQMNALYIINKYYDIKAGNIPKTPITFIFGAKAAPAYTIAKDIIHLLLCLSKLIEEDDEVSKYIKVVFVENYNVSEAQYLFPAADVSEQISLASKEASGTGNMKFMLNGALTLGTSDGANVEINDLVGDDNIFIFGKKSKEIIKLYETEGYSSSKLIKENAQIKKLVDFIVSDQLLAIGQKENLTRLHKEIVSKDWFMTLIDIIEYIEVKEKCFAAYEDKLNWSKMSLVNTAKAGYFSSDRTIAQYNADIWNLK